MDSTLQSPTSTSLIPSRSLRVLILENQTAEVELLIETLRTSAFYVECASIATEPDYLAVLATLPDLILSDYSLPAFTEMQALDLLRQQEKDVPFILISGAIVEQKRTRRTQAY